MIVKILVHKLLLLIPQLIPVFLLLLFDLRFYDLLLLHLLDFLELPHSGLLFLPVISKYLLRSEIVVGLVSIHTSPSLSFGCLVPLSMFLVLIVLVVLFCLLFTGLHFGPPFLSFLLSLMIVMCLVLYPYLMDILFYSCYLPSSLLFLKIESVLFMVNLSWNSLIYIYICYIL